MILKNVLVSVTPFLVSLNWLVSVSGWVYELILTLRDLECKQEFNIKLKCDC